MPTFNPGDEVLIIDGPYKARGKGVFLSRFIDRTKAFVKVNDDTVSERIINVSEMRRAPPPAIDPNERPEMVSITRLACEELLSNFETVRNDLAEMEERLRSLVD